ncbi:LytTR family DNA-binding domain-containing protein [Psychroserpens ponticola]|uniref:LytTR family DNA-binding domain-containing protein n=1 Tax=Psychroserpens ponticola TaxID=2932268 RepID=A0ABY7S1E4_9FLAO|nr:LytTR family DNA-binding domain-containing protein [Psychroserpens ponticola]WCO03218.1 LytTR family DNA-binding domain-containing protein [Psychroserpens ponticola]
MSKTYPFDPSIKHHLLIALGLCVWIFVFLYFTEPLDVNEFENTEKLIYLPLYGLIGALLYVMVLPFQMWLLKKSNAKWKLSKELLVLGLFIVFAIFGLRLFYLHFIVEWHPNAYTFWYHLKSIIFPAMLTILPIVIIGRFAFGKYKEKKLEEQKIEIQGEGNYESLRLQLNELICIQSSDNYIEVFYFNGANLKKTLIRNKLSVIDESFPELLRTHRSFIINPFHFQSWKTEKGKHFLLLAYDIEVPISKTYLDNVKAQLNSATD